MKEAKMKESGYVSYAVDAHNEYLRLIKVILKHADIVCFTVHPFLDSLEEFFDSAWAFLGENVLYMTCDRAIGDNVGEKTNLIFLKNDYFLYDFFINKRNMDDFKEDPKTGVTLENPVFIENKEIICYTITHEEICVISHNLFLELQN